MGNLGGRLSKWIGIGLEQGTAMGYFRWDFMCAQRQRSLRQGFSNFKYRWIAKRPYYKANSGSVSWVGLRLYISIKFLSDAAVTQVRQLPVPRILQHWINQAFILPISQFTSWSQKCLDFKTGYATNKCHWVVVWPPWGLISLLKWTFMSLVVFAISIQQIFLFFFLMYMVGLHASVLVELGVPYVYFGQ